MKQKRKTLAALVLLSLLSASVPFSASAQTAADFKTPEYYKAGGLELIRAADAYVLGYTGKGITVGETDLPVNFTSPELAPKTGSYDVEGVTAFDWAKLSHGTHVAGIMVAAKDDTGMHGIAFDAECISRRVANEYQPNGSFDSRSDLYEPYLASSMSGVKAINNSWGSGSLEESIKTDKDYAYIFRGRDFAKFYYVYGQIEQACAGDKLLVFAAGNAGHPFPDIDQFSTKFGSHAAYNMLNVTAADNHSLTANSDGTISGQQSLTYFSDLAGFLEDETLAAPGWQIYSANSNYAADGKADIAMNGTSMAAPYVTGASALVQQTFPYLSAKQLGDVLLSTANNQLNLTGYQVQMVAEKGRAIGFNIMFAGAPPTTPLSQDELKQLAKAAYKDYYLTPAGWYTKADWDERVDRYDKSKGDRGVQVYYYAGQQELVGQGVLDVSKAVRGPGALNARRLTKADLSTDYTLAGSTTSQALYPVDTAGYNSCWSNDIKEVKAGLIAKDSSEEDLLERWQYYNSNWISNAQALDGLRTVTSDYVKYFNNKVEASGLKGLSVGLYKSGDGILRLTGNNTYQGSTIAAGGTLAVDGSVAGDAWSVGGNSGSDSSEAGGTLAGSGTVNGNVYNKGTLKPGSYAVNSVYDTNPAFNLGTLTVKGQLNSTGALEVAADGTQNSKLAVSGSSSLTGSTFKVNPLHAPLLNHTYNYLTSEGGISGNVNPSLVSPYVTLTGSVIGNNAYLTASQTRTLGSLPGMTPSENSVGGVLNRLALQTVTARPDSSAAQTLNGLLYQDEAASRRFTKEVTSEGRAQLLSNSPLTRLTSETVYSRLDAADYSGLLGAEVTLPQLKESESGSEVMRTTTPVSLDASNNLWFKLFKGYETYNYNDELKNHTFGGAVGYDHAVNLTTRVGGLFSYGVTNYSTDNISGDSHDWRLGAYVDHKNGNWDYQGLVSYGRNKYDLDRSINLAGSGLGNSTLNSDYQAKVWDVEAKAKYLIPSTKDKTWQLTPYGKLSYTHTNQDAYSETAGGSSMASSGGSVFAQNIESASNNSTRGEIGLEFKRSYDKHGGWGGSVGYKRVISGVNPELNGTFAGDTLSGNGFTIQSDNDKNFVTYSLNVHGSLGGRWTGQAELRGEASQNTHKEIISVAAKYSF